MGVVCSIREALHVGKHLAGYAEHTQLIQVSVGQDVLLFLQTLMTQLDDLREDRQKAGGKLNGDADTVEDNKREGNEEKLKAVLCTSW